ncbi:AAA family ATPase [bacterium]|nr:AAA family ATPase [bacterium]
MYEQHWHLQQPAFRSCASANFFYGSRSHEAALLKLRYLVEQRQGIALLTGVSGSGKSYVIDTFCQQLPADAGPVVPILFPQLTSSELLGYITAKLESVTGAANGSTESLDYVLQRLELAFQQLTRAGRHPVIVIDDAHLIADRKVFQTLQLLLNYRRANEIDFSVLLAGNPELVGQVKRYTALHERMAFMTTLQAFNAEETAEYVQHRLQAAGATESIFDQPALASIYQLSGGSPRLINRLCDFALLVGYADNLDHVTSAQVEAVAEELALAA